MTDYKLIANAVRALSMDAVQQANSGHPGAPMGMAEMAAVLWGKHLNVNPANPQWINRDRFVLSNGHASMLLYSMLHLSGFDVSLDDLKSFRQLHSKTPGHPEVFETPGVETTTGPLGQGIANAVGMALAEAHLAARYNSENHTIIDHHTYCFLGDGCLMEGVAHEACSLAGTLGLGKLIALYDANGISIDGEVKGWFSENIRERFQSYGWQVIGEIDGHDPEAINQAITEAKADTVHPSLIICRTTIGYGSPNLAGSEKSHGAPLGHEEIVATKDILGLPRESFVIPQEVYAMASLREKGKESEADWQQVYQAWKSENSTLATEFERVIAQALPENLDEQIWRELKNINEQGDKVATRKASEQALNVLAPMLPELLGGSADLSGSNNTWHKGSVSIKHGDFAGNYVHYGVREFAMGAMMNGVYLHGGLRPYGGTFLVFSDYMRNAMRLSALMKLPVVYVLTHDSIGLGEDGPTHQPIEHVSSLRLMPNMNVWRPCDAAETLVAWHSALNHETPSALALSRQGLPYQKRNDEQLKAIYRGGYVLQAADDADVVLIASGSEVELVVAAADELRQQGKKVRVVSIPCLDVFWAQDTDYQRSVLGDAPRVVVEAGATAVLKALAGDKGIVVGIDRFGASAPASVLFEEYGLTVGNIVKNTLNLI